MDKIRQYLKESYPRVASSNGYREAKAELNALIGEHGLKGARKVLREAGVSLLPIIIPTYPDGDYTFKSCTTTILVDWKEQIVCKHNLGFVGISGVYNTEFIRDGLRCFVSDQGSSHDGYYLSYWIEYGEICEDCGVAFIDREHTHVCETCSASYRLLEYHAKAEDLLGLEETRETLFGIELEYEDLTAKQVAHSLKGHAISKRDGSLSSKGCEVVTRPACVQTHKAKLKPFYDTVKVAAASNTGMHVHVDKSKLSNYQIGFMMEFLNKETLIPHIEVIAGRSYSTNTYCRADTSKKMTWGNSWDDSAAKTVRCPTGKYSPLNTAKDRTIEIRIFSSPESLLECSAKLDFVAALVKYSSPYAISVKRLQDKFTWETFLSFVVANKKEFPDFVALHIKKEA